MLRLINDARVTQTSMAAVWDNENKTLSSTLARFMSHARMRRERAMAKNLRHMTMIATQLLYRDWKKHDDDDDDGHLGKGDKMNFHECLAIFIFFTRFSDQWGEWKQQTRMFLIIKVEFLLRKMKNENLILIFWRVCGNILANLMSWAVIRFWWILDTFCVAFHSINSETKNCENVMHANTWGISGNFAKLRSFTSHTTTREAEIMRQHK